MFRYTEAQNSYFLFSKAFDITYVFNLVIIILFYMSQSQNLPFTWKIANVKMTKTS